MTQDQEAGLDRIREVIQEVIARRQGGADAALGAKPSPKRSYERFMDGGSVRWSSLTAIESRLGLSELTFKFVRDAEFDQALELDNPPYVRTLVGAMKARQPAAAPKVRRSVGRTA